MRPNPLSDALAFMTQPIWPIALLWALLLVSLVFAIRATRLHRPSPRAGDFGIWLIRALVGCMWWQQSMWKVPPNYDGLVHWMTEMTEHAAIPLLGNLVRDTVIPNINLFGPLVYGIEVVVAVSLILGVASRLGALLGLAMALNLWLGLYSAPGEWPWTYMFLVVIQALWVINPPGYSLGVDALVAARRLPAERPVVVDIW